MISSLLISLISLSIATVAPDFLTTTCRSSSSCLASRLNGRSEHIEKSQVHHSSCHMAGIYNQSMISNYVGRGCHTCDSSTQHICVGPDVGPTMSYGYIQADRPWWTKIRNGPPAGWNGFPCRC